VQIELYLFLINRLYLDALSMRLGNVIVAAVQRLDRSKLFEYVAALCAIGVTLSAAKPIAALPAAQLAALLAAAFLLPLFPFHGLHVAAVSRLPASGAIAAAVSAPAAGLYLLAAFSADMPAAVLGAIGALALLGVLYASLKSLAQMTLPTLAAYASTAFFSIFWWCFAVKKTYGSEAVLYVFTVVLLTIGLLLTAHRLQQRYGDLALDRLHGLAKPMPRFATLFGLLVMAAVGLPPFGFFSSHFTMLAQLSGAHSGGLIIVLLAWFIASWYLFRMMQRLLFGPHREDLAHGDFRPGEIITFVAVLLALLLLGIAPRHTASSDRMNHGDRAALEIGAW
jgi:NADH-quinone oxidoreductase subunit M